MIKIFFLGLIIISYVWGQEFVELSKVSQVVFAGELVLLKNEPYLILNKNYNNQHFVRLKGKDVSKFIGADVRIKFNSMAKDNKNIHYLYTSNDFELLGLWDIEKKLPWFEIR
jgi:hypothetical protein